MCLYVLCVSLWGFVEHARLVPLTAAAQQQC